MIVQQGSTYSMSLKIRIHGVILTDTDVSKIEVKFSNGLTKKYPETITFDTDHFVVPLTQQESFAMSGNVSYQVRVLFPDGTVKGSNKMTGVIVDTISKEVLS